MAISTGRRLRDGFLALFGLSVVASGMAAIDETARQHLFNALHGELPSVPAAFQFHTIARQVGEFFPIGDTSFVAFGVVGFVLLVFMFKM
jgi:hypothetical protein